MDTEELAYWFSRLNGCFTFKNFAVHPDEDGAQRTDVDLVALRFRHRQELRNASRAMEDHELLRNQEKYIVVYFVEVKTGECQLNGPWRERNRANMQPVFDALGFFPENEIDPVAQELYKNFRVTRQDIQVSFAMVGKRPPHKRLIENGIVLEEDRTLLTSGVQSLMSGELLNFVD